MSADATAPVHGSDATRALLDLAHRLGREDRRLAILGEGNVSMALGADDFLVKASGHSLETLGAPGAVACRRRPLVTLIDTAEAAAGAAAGAGRAGSIPDDADAERALYDARLDPVAAKPSVEALFHADLLGLAGVSFVAHTHPEAVNAFLCSPAGEQLATTRIFPDEIVCCGAASVFVPYVDPGLALAVEIRRRTRAFLAMHGVVPRVVLLANHGMIALGPSAAAVLATTRMAVKSARIRLGAAGLGGATALSPADVARIAGRADEHYRQRQLGL